jgi:hypothetical protein
MAWHLLWIKKALRFDDDCDNNYDFSKSLLPLGRDQLESAKWELVARRLTH